MFEYVSHMTFAWPWAWLLMLLPLIARFFIDSESPQQEEVRVPFLPDIINELNIEKEPQKSGRLTRLVFWLVWSLLICALSRPEYLTPPQYIEKPMRDIVLLLDVSGSMNENDVQGGVTRLQAVKNSVLKFISLRSSDRIGLVIFASKAWPFAPISEDKQALKNRINSLIPGMIGEQTAIGDAVGVAVKLLSNSREEYANKLAILLTDGNDTASQLAPTLAAQLAAAHHVQVHTIAFGDINGKGEDKVDLMLLQEIAKITGGKSWTAANSGGALDSVWKEIDTITPRQVKSLGWSWHLPLFQWPLTFSLLLIVFWAGVRFVKGKVK